MLLDGACARCQFKTVFGLFRELSFLSPQQCHQSRGMVTAMRQRRQPSRMTLSPTVDRSGAGKGKPQPSPFGGMNQTEARIGGRRTARPPIMQRSGTGQRGAPRMADKARRSPTSKPEKPAFHALKMQATLAPLAYSQRSAIKEKLARIESFEEFNLLPDIRDAVYNQALAGLTDIVPTPAQKLAIPALLSKKGQHIPKKKSSESGDATARYDQFLIAAETGSGKTLAYLLPVIDAIKRQEMVDKIDEGARKEREEKEQAEREKRNPFDLKAPELADSPHSTTGRPRALILLPSSELVSQVGGVVKSLAHVIKYRSAPLSSAQTPQRIRNQLYNPRGIDIIVSNPHLISSIAETDPNILSRVTHLVIDEADSLLDRSFAATTSAVIDRAAPSLKQLILCSATIPRRLDSFLDKRFPAIKRLVTPKLHSISRRVQLGAVDIEKEPYRGNRNLACADVIWTIGKATHDDTGPTHSMKCLLVFVNTRETAEELAPYLVSKGIDAVALTRDTTEQRQAEILSIYTSPTKVEGSVKEKAVRRFEDFIPFDTSSLSAINTTTTSSFMSASANASRPSRHLADTKVLVTTDLGSRGIDTLAVRHVILYDVPHTTIDFVHRLGRMGRMGRRGRGVVLTGKHDRKDIVAEVRDAMFRGQALI